MRKELQEIESIENYLLGKMSDKEVSDFEKNIKIDSDLKEKVELQKSIIVGLERIGLKNEMAKAKQMLFLKKVASWIGLGILVTAIIVGGVLYLRKETIKDSELMEHDTFSKSNLKITKADSIDESKADTSLIENIKSDSPSESKLQQKQSDRSIDSSIETWRDSPNDAKLPTKEFQYFKINPTKANTIKGSEGTIIKFKANCFDTESDEIVTVKLKEFYKMSDIVFANLTTQTNSGELLETGGMVYIEAIQANKKLELKHDKPIELRFPTKNKKDGMKTFLGEKNKNGNVLWKEEVKGAEPISNFEEPLETIEEVEVFTIVENMPAYRECISQNRREIVNACTNDKVFDFIQKNIKIPKGAFASGVDGTCYAKYTVNEIGIVENVQIIRSVNPLLDELVKEAILSLPQFIPGMQRGRPIKVQFTIPVKFKDFGDAKGYSEQNYTKSLEEATKRVALKKEKALNEIFTDDVLDTTLAQTNIQSNLNYYVLNCNSLNWINCDKFMVAAKDRVTIAIYEKDRNARVQLIFKSISSIMQAKVGSSRHSFTRIPKDKEVVIFASKFIDNQLYIAIDEIKTKNEVRTLDYKLATKDLIKNYAEILNQKPLN